VNIKASRADVGKRPDDELLRERLKHLKVYQQSSYWHSRMARKLGTLF
jgi:hypothetical protein